MADENISQMQAFYIPDAVTSDSVLISITQALFQAAKMKVHLAIIGPNSTQNAALLKTIFQSVPNNSLRGATIIFVNDGEDTEHLRNDAERRGAIFRSVKYTGK